MLVVSGEKRWAWVSEDLIIAFQSDIRFRFSMNRDPMPLVGGKKKIV